MTTTSPATDVSAFLQALTFTTGALAALKAEIHSAPDQRKAVEQAVKDLPENPDGKDALRSATGQFLLSRPRIAEEVLKRAPETPQTVLLRGLIALEMCDPSAASTSLGSLVGTEVDDEAFLMRLATASALAGDADLAHRAAAKLPDGADALYAEGIALEAEGDYRDARAKYEEAIARDPHHRFALFRLALRQDTDGEVEASINTYRRCASLRPVHINPLINLALIYEDVGRHSEAETLYRRVLAADPNHVRAKIGLKDVLASQNMFYDEDHERREDRRAQVLRTPISEFELSVRSRNCLSKMNITTLGDLVSKSEAELLAYKNFGETSLQEIKDILAQKGLRLGMSNEDDQPLYAGQAVAATANVDAIFGGTPEAGSTGMDPTDLPIEHLDLSIRARRCMDNLEIRTIADLLRHSESELLASKNFGQTSLNELRRKLDAMNLTLRRK